MFSFIKIALCLVTIASVASIVSMGHSVSYRSEETKARLNETGFSTQAIIFPGSRYAIVRDSNSEGIFCFMQYSMVPMDSIPMFGMYMQLAQQVAGPWQSVIQSMGINPCMFLDQIPGLPQGGGSSSGSGSSSSGSSGSSGGFPFDISSFLPSSGK